MTTNTVQLTIDLAVLLRGQGELEDLARARCRVRLGFSALSGFVAGCAVGAFFEIRFGLWALLLPVALDTIAVYWVTMGPSRKRYSMKNDQTLSSALTLRQISCLRDG